MSGQDVKRIRERLKLSVPQFATILGVHPGTVYRWEAARHEEVSVEGTAKTVLEALRFRLAGGEAEPANSTETDRVLQAYLVGGALLGLAAIIAIAVGGGKVSVNA